MPDLLRRAGLRIVCHDDEFTDNLTPDPVWIERCANKDWVIVTGDKAIETDPINRQAVIDFKAKVFLLDENNSRAIEWASAIIVGRRKLATVTRDNDGPFFASVRKNVNGVITNVRKP
jgi:hypothetical protein